MNTIRRTGTLAVALLASTALAFPAMAQDAGEEEGSEIIVTAQKRSENLQDVPISIAALGEARLEQANVAAFDDYAKLMPSVSFQSFGPGQSQIFFRGVSSGGDGLKIGPLPTSSLYIDETPVTTIAGSVDFHVYDIARVEALAGPQGTLFGASSLSGTLRMITNAPDPSGFSGRVDATVNKFGEGDAGGTLEGYLNLPVSANAALRVVAFWKREGGYIDNIPGVRVFSLDDGDPTTNLQVGNGALVREDYNPVETYGGRAALKIDLDDNWTVTPAVTYQKMLSQGSYAYDPSVGDLKLQRFAPEYLNDKWIQAALTIEGKLGSWDVTYAGAYLDRKRNSSSDYTDYSEAYDSLYASVGGLAGYFYFLDSLGRTIDPRQKVIGSDHFKKLSQELRIASPADKPLRFVGGV
ncbi:MAG: hypothetical protein RIQ46_2125, partial [Pseudomonadota bacterium]